MALSNYTELQASMAGWLMGRDDLTDRIPDFVLLTEADLNLNLRCREMMTTPAAITPTASVYTLPTDFIEAARVQINTDPVSILEPASLDYATENYSTNPASSYPRFFTIDGSNLTAYPSSTGTLSLTYYRAIPPLASNSTNWLLTKSPAVYLYGSLAQAAPYLEDDQRLQVWAGLYDRALQGLLKADTRAIYSKVSARVKGATP